MKRLEELIEYVTPFYKDKDVMHDLSHIKRVIKTADSINKDYDCNFNLITWAAYFHGFIYENENLIRKWLIKNDYANVDLIIQVAWESQKNKEAKTLEGKILHDAHMIEGGKTFLVLKSLITGSVRGQSLEETIKYIEDNVLDKGECYLEESKLVHKEALDYARKLINELKEVT